MANGESRGHANPEPEGDLTIFWLQEGGHVEVPGIYFYGYWGDVPTPRASLRLSEFWELVASELSLDEFEAEQGHFLAVAVWVKSWPADSIWRSAVEGTLKKMIELGAQVAWCGGELTSWSLTELDPKTYAGCIYAAASVDREPIMHSELWSDQMIFLSEDEISRLGFRNQDTSCN